MKRLLFAALFGHRLTGHRVFRYGWMVGPHHGRIWLCLDCQREVIAPDWTNALGRFEWREKG